MAKQGGANVTNVKGLYSYSDGTASNAARVEPMCGPGSNSDMSKSNKLLKQSQSKVDSLRGKSGK